MCTHKRTSRSKEAGTCYCRAAGHRQGQGFCTENQPCMLDALVCKGTIHTQQTQHSQSKELPECFVDRILGTLNLIIRTHELDQHLMVHKALCRHQLFTVYQFMPEQAVHKYCGI